MRLTIITPAFNEAANLEALHARIVSAMSAASIDWDWIVVDDHSRDDTFGVIGRIAARDARVAGLRLARNSGSHTAIACALRHASGDAAVLLAADLQDPPEVVPLLLEQWRGGAQVVWGVRRLRAGETRRTVGFARLYYFIMRRYARVDLPATGTDLFLVDRAVIDALGEFTERPSSIFALLTWLGFRQAFVEYDKAPRHGGRSGWTLRKKVALVIDSVTAFSEFPIRWCSYAGVALIVSSPLVGVFWQALAGLAVGLSGLQLLALGIVGEYVWRALLEARRRPHAVIEAAVGRLAPGIAGAAHD
jgi:polyisoprenyl-phosphate glycosyltransferase